MRKLFETKKEEGTLQAIWRWARGNFYIVFFDK